MAAWIRRNAGWLILGIIILFVFAARKLSAATKLTQDKDGFPNDERATKHFTWKELLSQSGHGSNPANLTPDEYQTALSVARLGELIRKLHGDLPFLLRITALGTEDNGNTVWAATASPLPGESLEGLFTTVGDVATQVGKISVITQADQNRIVLYGEPAAIVKSAADGSIVY